MPCPQCDTLKATIAELRDEIAAWKAADGYAHRDAAFHALLERGRAAFGLTSSQALMVMAMIDRNGVACTYAALHAAARHRPNHPVDREVVSEKDTVTAIVCRLRARLSAHALGRAVRTVYGHGYVVDREWIARLKAKAGEGVSA